MDPYGPGLALSLDIKSKDICHPGHVGGRDQGILDTVFLRIHDTPWPNIGSRISLDMLKSMHRVSVFVYFAKPKTQETKETKALKP